jgi:cysteine desulfurase
MNHQPSMVNGQMSHVYLDHAATTPVDPGVIAAMQPYFSEQYGNPSSLHSLGQKAREVVDDARRTVAKTIGVSSAEICFTSGGTESNNLALFGVADAYRDRGAHLITSTIEHESVLEPLKILAKHQNHRVSYLPVDRYGLVKIETLVDQLTSETILVSVMTANNEVGTLQPIEAIAQALKSYKKSIGRSENDPPFFHTDACQAAGVLDLATLARHADLFTLNGGKIYGPKGIGLLFIRKGVRLTPRQWGGGQESGRRSGTENVPAIIGLAEALKHAQAERTEESARLLALRETLWQGIQSQLTDVQLNGHPLVGDAEPRRVSHGYHATSPYLKELPNNLNLSIKGCPGEILLMKLDEAGIYASAGSACTAGSADPSHVLLAMGVSREDAYNTVRFSLGKSNTAEQIDRVVEVFVRVVKEIREEQG